MNQGVTKSRTKSLYFSVEDKKKILRELELGRSPAELSREHQVTIRSIYNWKRSLAAAGDKALKTGEDLVPSSELKKAYEEIKRLRQALGKVTLDLEIMKDAVDIASKKKWI